MSEKDPLIVVDSGIPGAETHLEGFGRVRMVPADAIRAVALRDAHAVIVRSVTRIDASLLEETAVRFVGSATSGTDHVDRAWLRSRGIRFAHARGANADSVVDYVIAGLLRVAVRNRVDLSGRTVGVIGCGNVGGRLAARLPHLGMGVLLRDPPRDRRLRAAGRHSPYVSMDRILAESDIVTLHTPLIRHGRDATHHLVDERFLDRMRDDAWLVNTARGSVMDGNTVRDAWARGRSGCLLMDVWEGEPLPDADLVSRADVATAHIAGYAADSKLEATRRIARSLARYLGRPVPRIQEDRAPLPLRAPDVPPDPIRWLDALVHTMYPIERDDAALRAIMAHPGDERALRFEDLRRFYPERRLFRRYGMDARTVPDSLQGAVFGGLGLKRLSG